MTLLNVKISDLSQYPNITVSPAKSSFLCGGPLAARLCRRGGLYRGDGGALGVVAAAVAVVQVVVLVVFVEGDRRRHRRGQRWGAVMVVAVVVIWWGAGSIL